MWLQPELKTAPALRFVGLLNGQPIAILFDFGTERNCESEQFLEKRNVAYLDLEQINVLIQSWLMAK